MIDTNDIRQRLSKNTAIDAKEIQALCDEVERNQWISVEDRYPDINQQVIIAIPLSERHSYEGAQYMGKGKFLGTWCGERGKGCAYTVEYWKPLQPPKQ